MIREPLEAYLRHLRRELGRDGRSNPRIVAEAREHLLDAIDDGVRRGLPIDAAEREAVARFGDPQALGTEFRRIYRWDCLVWHLAQVAAAVVASIAVALAIQILVNLRFELQTEAWRLAPGFSRATRLSLAVVLGLVTAWEMGRPPFSWRRAAAAAGTYAGICGLAQVLIGQSVRAFVIATVLVALGAACSRLDSRPARWVLTLVVFAAAEYGIHAMLSVAFGPSQALLAGAVLLAVCASTALILTRVDHAFLNVCDPFES